MISLQRSMHSSQMYTPGPAISFLTWRCDFPQKLQRSCSLESVGLAISLLPLDRSGRALDPVPRIETPGAPGRAGCLGLYRLDHPVYEVVLLRLLGGHEVVTLRVARDLLQRL